MIFNLTKKTILSHAPWYAVSFQERLRGMIGRRFDSFDAAVFSRCSAVHTYFMRIPLDLVFIGPDNVVQKVVSPVLPWSFCICCRKASTVIELPVGAAACSGTVPGDVLDLAAELSADSCRKIGLTPCPDGKTALYRKDILRHENTLS